MLAEAQDLLAPHALVGLDHPWQRKALSENIWLAIAYTVDGQLEQACAVARLALQRLEHVCSPRCVDLLRTLRGELRRGRHTHPWVREFLPELNAALRRHAA